MLFRDLKAQYASMQPRMGEAISAVLEHGRYIGGPEVGELEHRLAEYVGAEHCVTCANGTDALQLALMAWGVGPGDAVFVPDFTFFASGEAPASLGATCVFVDVDERTFNLDSAKLERAVRFVKDKTDLVPKAVVAVDLFGLPADYPVIRAVCEKHGLLLLEDGAQGFGGSIGAKRACSFGDVSTTSFFPAKPLGCYGDGGAVFTDSDEWAALVRSLAVHGKGAGKYDNVRIGMNSRLDTLQAAVLLVKLEALELDAVDDAARRYGKLLAGSNLVLPEIPCGFRSSWAQYTVCLPPHSERDMLQAALESQGVPTMVYYPKPMHSQRAFEKACLCPGGCPVTERLCQTVLSLPMGPYLTEQDARAAASSLIAGI